MKKIKMIDPRHLTAYMLNAIKRPSLIEEEPGDAIDHVSVDRRDLCAILSLVIDSYIPQWTNYITVDHNGDVRAHETRPESIPDIGKWVSSGRVASMYSLEREDPNWIYNIMVWGEEEIEIE